MSRAKAKPSCSHLPGRRIHSASPGDPSAPAGPRASSLSGSALLPLLPLSAKPVTHSRAQRGVAQARQFWCSQSPHRSAPPANTLTMAWLPSEPAPVAHRAAAYQDSGQQRCSSSVCSVPQCPRMVSSQEARGLEWRLVSRWGRRSSLRLLLQKERASRAWEGMKQTALLRPSIPLRTLQFSSCLCSGTLPMPLNPPFSARCNGREPVVSPSVPPLAFPRSP